MSLSEEDRRRIYEEEKARIEAQEQVKAELATKRAEAINRNIQAQRQQKAQATKQSWLAYLIVIVTIGIVVYFMSLGNSISPNTSSSTDTSSRSNSNSSSSTVEIGEVGVLDDGGDDNVLLAPTEDVENKLVDAAVAKDKVGYNQVVIGGNCFAVARGSHALLIGYGSGLLGATKYHVRIQGGTHDTEDGWIPQEWLKKQ